MSRCDLFRHCIMMHWFIFSTFLLQKSARLSPWRNSVICFRPCEFKIPHSFKICVFPSSILISFHHHYLLFATLNWVKITNIPMSPLRSRKFLQVRVIQLYVDLTVRGYDILLFVSALILNISSPRIFTSCFYIRIYFKIIRLYCLFLNCFWLLMQIKFVLGYTYPEEHWLSMSVKMMQVNRFCLSLPFQEFYFNGWH